MQLDRHGRVEDFDAAAGEFLAAREAEHNLMLGIVSTLTRDPEGYEGPPLLATVQDDGDVVAAAVRTPPYNLVLSEVDDLGAIPILVDALRAEALPGIVGPPAAVRAFADAWTGARGGSWRLGREERIYRLSEVNPPAAGDGSARLADAADRGLIGTWLGEFEREALDEEAEVGMIERALNSWSGGARRFWLCEVDGRAVSIVGAGGRTPNGVRIGPVYTPVGDRGHGYASRLTAWVSQAMLDEGQRFCFLYTDLANRTSNHIYQAIGYGPVADASMVYFR